MDSQLNMISRCTIRSEYKPETEISRVLSPLKWFVVIYLGLSLPADSSVLPDHRAGHPIAVLFGLAAGGVCTAGPVTRSAVGSYPAFSPLPVSSGEDHRRYVFCCTFHRFTPSGR